VWLIPGALTQLEAPLFHYTTAPLLFDAPVNKTFQAATPISLSVILVCFGRGAPISMRRDLAMRLNVGSTSTVAGIARRMAAGASRGARPGEGGWIRVALVARLYGLTRD
jgi:hypothetical protein